MGTAKTAILIVAAVASRAYADPCTGDGPYGRFATCFDLGNRLSVTAGSDGAGGSVAIRHEITFEDDPDLEWKMEHVMVDGTYNVFANEITGTLYRGRYIRHARDGHIVLPLGTPKKIFLPFDIGALAEVGTIDWRPATPIATIGMIKTAPLVDFARARNYRSLFAFGPVARWDIDFDQQMQAIADQVVAPFTEGLANIHLESATGLYVADLRVEAGEAWRTNTGWKPEARAEASLERIMLAINDRPIALTVGVRYDSVRDETIARIGARFVIFDRPDPRVSLDPLHARLLARLRADLR